MTNQLVNALSYLAHLPYAMRDYLWESSAIVAKSFFYLTRLVSLVFPCLVKERIHNIARGRIRDNGRYHNREITNNRNITGNIKNNPNIEISIVNKSERKKNQILFNRHLLTSKPFSKWPKDKDPLNEQQKKEIFNYVNEQLKPLLLHFELKVTKEKDRQKEIELLNLQDKILTALSKPYDGNKKQRSLLQQAKEILGKESYDNLRTILKGNSSCVRPFAKQYGTSLFAKVCIKHRLDLYNTFKNMNGWYYRKLRGKKSTFEYTIRPLSQFAGMSKKHQMLLTNDPVISKQMSKGSDLDDILTNTHFDPSGMTITHCDAKGNVRVEKRGPTREETRKIIQKEFRKLEKNPHTRHLITALAKLSRMEKLNILFSGSCLGTGELGVPYGARSNIMGGVAGFYQNHHTIIMASLIHPYDKTVQRSHVGTLAHESLHLLLKSIFGNDSLPHLPKDNKGETLLLDAIEKDMAHRQEHNFPANLNQNECAVYQTFVSDLEKDTYYFPPTGFDRRNQKHQKTMMIEAIVRPMEQIASGRSEAEIKKVAPNVYNYYIHFVKPKIEQWCRGSELEF